MIQGVTILGDVIRPHGKGEVGGTDRPVRWLYNAIKRSVFAACGLPVDVVGAAACPEIADWIARSRSAADAALFWASLYRALPTACGIADLLVERLRGQFCVGYELPPYMIRLLDRAGIPWIDLRIHPVRFMDDLLFAVRCGVAETQAVLPGLAVAESAVIVTAGLREAMCQLISDATVPPDTLILVGQRPMDSSQIVGGGFFDAFMHETEIAAVCARYQAVVLKPHPQPDAPHSLLLVASRQPNVRGVIDDNLYRMLALPQVAAVLTVNSSIAYEAGYFGKTAHCLAPLPFRVVWRGDALPRDAYASLDDRVLTPDFWRLVLEPHTAVTPADGMLLPAKPNRLRIALDSFWNYQQIDTDRIPRGII